MTSQPNSDPLRELPVNVPGYRDFARLGGGGMGVVYKAWNEKLERCVAIKFLPIEYAQDRQLSRRFQQEAKTLGALSHPNICTIYDTGMHEGHPYIVMELVEGQTLKDLIGQSLSLTWLAEFIRQTARALAAAHENHIIHRDIKPENIMVRDDGYVKVLDFGLAYRRAEANSDSPSLNGVATSPGTVVGTASYMSPEQARGATVEDSTDVFSLGIVLYQLATGRHPFGSEYPNNLLSSTPRQTAPRFDQVPVAKQLRPLLTEMLSEDPRSRPAASEVAKGLEGFCQELPGSWRSLNKIKTVVSLDLVGYTKTSLTIEQILGPDQVMELNHQIQKIVNDGLAAVQVDRESAVRKKTGDGALLVFDRAELAHHFAKAVHLASQQHNQGKCLLDAKRLFRIGAATGEIAEDEEDMAGTTIGKAVHMEKEANSGELIIDTATYWGLPSEVQELYENEEEIKLKHEILTKVRRCAMLPRPKPSPRHRLMRFGERLWRGCRHRRVLSMSFVLMPIILGLVLIPWWFNPRELAVESFVVYVNKKEEDESRQLYKLKGRPLKVGDSVRFSIKLNHAAYIYVLLIDSKSEVVPLYPWTNITWTNRDPKKEPETAELHLPALGVDPYPIKADRKGIESIVVLVRDQPLSMSDQRLLQNLSQSYEQKPVYSKTHYKMWENGKIKGQGSLGFGTPNDTVKKMQSAIWEQVKGTFPLVRSVTFANQGGD